MYSHVKKKEKIVFHYKVLKNGDNIEADVKQIVSCYKLFFFL